MSEETTEEYMTFEEQIMDAVLTNVIEMIKNGDLYLGDTINDYMHEQETLTTILEQEDVKVA